MEILSGATSLPGVKAGHYTDSRRPTGCTVLLFEDGATASVDVRGGGPGTRETDLLLPVSTVSQIHGLVLSGGSAFGLDSAGGVMRYLAERDVGFRLGSRVVPIVPAAVLYDLAVGEGDIYPDAAAGYAACQCAAAFDELAEGSMGVGAGATVGKMFGMQAAMKAGIGISSVRLEQTDIIVAALVAVNAIGDVYAARSPTILAGARAMQPGHFLNSMESLLRSPEAVGKHLFSTNTTIGAILTNAAFDKAQLQKIAQMGHDGLARTINPVHTPYDGDTLFAVSCGNQAASVSAGLVGAVAAEVVAQAVERAVSQARGLPGLPCAAQWGLPGAD